MKVTNDQGNLPLAQTIRPVSDGTGTDFIYLSPKRGVPAGARLDQVMLAVVLVMAGVFLWTCWNIVHGEQARPTQWLIVLVTLLAVCLLATAAAVGTAYWSRRAAAKSTRLAQGRDLLLRTLVDNLPDAVYAKDTSGRKILANPADLKNLGRQTEAEVIGKSDFDLFPKEVAEKFYADDQKVLQGQAVINREEYFLNEAGEKRWLMTSKLPLYDQGLLNRY